MKKVSIVIVCMNNIGNLNICLPSIAKYTTKIDYKIYVVAYLFSKDNLKLLKEKYPDVIVIESNEIRGFAENNNLALKQVTSEFVFILNDDTELKEPVIEKLMEAYKKTPDVTIMSPVLLLGNGNVQFNGRRKYTFGTFILGLLGFHNLIKSKYENQKGIFRTYNISGAAFLIKTKDFKKIGFFDERFFFCPEDIAVSTTINRNGGCCYVDSDTRIIHYHGISSKKSDLFYATSCASFLGFYIFYCDTYLKRVFFIMILKMKVLVMSILHKNQHRIDYMYIYNNVLRAIKRHHTPKELFIHEYNKVKSKK